MELYSEDLAYVHHHGFGDFACGAAPGVIRELRRAGIHDGYILDLGCGSGILAKRLAGAGYKVLGIDSSAALLKLARKESPRTEFLCASLHEVKLPDCDVVTAIGEAFNYIPPGGSPHSLPVLIRRVAKSLRCGGLFIFDMMVQHRRQKPYRTWKAGDDWAVLVEVSEPARDMLLRKIITYRKIGKTYRRWTEEHRLALPQRPHLLHHLHKAGFAVRVSRSYGNFLLGPHRFAFVARKR